MKRKSIGTIVLSLFLLAVASATVSAKPLVINLGYASSEGSPYAVLADKFKELAEKYGKGTIEVKVRGAAQLATEDEAFKAMQLGTLDMYVITSNNVSPHFPLMDAFVLPYIFQNKDHTYKILNGPVGAKFSEDLKKATGVWLLTYGWVGHRDFYNSVRPINKMSDMAGLKIRVPKNDVMIDTYRAFGAAPIPLPWAETPTALQTGTVSGADNGTHFIKTQKFYEMMKHLSILEHFCFFNPLFASGRVMGKMSQEQKEAVLKAAADAGKYHVEVMEDQVAEIRKFLANQGGMATTYPDKSEFIATSLSLQDRFLAGKDQSFKDLVMAIRAAAQ
jgi:tripartite ATP-independent transporter DctP family solute receptor